MNKDPTNRWYYMKHQSILNNGKCEEQNFNPKLGDENQEVRIENKLLWAHVTKVDCFFQGGSSDVLGRNVVT